MANVTIAVINECSLLSDQEIAAAVPDLATQIHQDFAPVWGTDADLVFIKKGEERPAGKWWLCIVDDPDRADVFGYHDVTKDNLPMGKVFVRFIQQSHGSWTVTASHELLEMLADPDLTLSVFTEKDTGDCRLYAYEVCDPCATDDDSYLIGQTRVSDFVYPAWFETFHEGAQFDKQNRIKRPFELASNGSIEVNDIVDGRGWKMLWSDSAPDAIEMRRPRVGSRRERRRTPRALWRRSTVSAPIPTS